MHDRVLHQRLQGEFRYHAAVAACVAVHFERNSLTEAKLLERNIVAQQVDLACERYDAVVVVERIAEEVCETHDHIARHARPFDTGDV